MLIINRGWGAKNNDLCEQQQAKHQTTGCCWCGKWRQRECVNAAGLAWTDWRTVTSRSSHLLRESVHSRSFLLEPWHYLCCHLKTSKSKFKLAHSTPTETHLRATEHHLQYKIRQCYLPPDTGTLRRNQKSNPQLIDPKSDTLRLCHQATYRYTRY